MPLLRQVTNHNQGVEVNDVIKLVQALVVSRVVYSTPHLPLKPRKMNQPDRLLRKAHKQAPRFPPHTASSRLEKLGVYSKVREIVDAHLDSQVECLRQTSTGRTVVRQLGIV
ncbi:hypothetical protein HPB48_008109 [Haemaphysalis longicornis]|uniref:Uncharacterized protein n=1 Tax=Haemaphysalis longicornis TaxID=44386 RepID=A0A9J6GV96_HAELO|nr:hypothetical protein HPB48_008109 [Haemaphysalis longicornis]